MQENVKVIVCMVVRDAKLLEIDVEGSPTINKKARHKRLEIR